MLRAHREGRSRGTNPMRQVFRNSGLSLVLLFLFILFWVGQTITGFKQHNDEQRAHGEPTVSMREYVTSGHFWSATAENWESEFLQMAMYVLLTIFLFQKGASESKKPDEAIQRPSRPRPNATIQTHPGPSTAESWS